MEGYSSEKMRFYIRMLCLSLLVHSGLFLEPALGVDINIASLLAVFGEALSIYQNNLDLFS